MKLRRTKTNAPSGPIQLPERGQAALLSTGSGGRIPVTVTERGINTLVVAVMVPTRSFSAADFDGLVLEYSDARGRVRLRGHASMADPADPDLVRIDDPRSVEVLQEREYVRICSARPVVVYAGGDRQEMQSYTVDLSGGGFLLAGPETLKIGEELKFRLSIAQGQPPITGRGRIVRADPQGRLAIAFEEISELDRRRLVRFIFECQRKERSRGLQDGRSGGGA